jgi:hypothetical protein
MKYFDWLCTLIRFPNDGHTYLGLMQIMHAKEFVWIVGNDDNRLSDGRDLRVYYINAGLDIGDPQFKNNGPVSVLEVLIGLSSRLAFLMDGNSKVWAWQLVENLGLHKKFDPIDQATEDAINEILDNLIWRTYEYDGSGGFFPLRFPEKDQTKVEIWYQMAAWIEELDN